MRYDTDTPTIDWIESEYLVENDFDNLAIERIDLKEERDRLDARIEELNLEIGAMLATARLKSVVYTNKRLTLGYATSGGYISKEKLLEAGVTAEQIARATTPKKLGKPYIRITDVHEKERL